MLNGNVFSWLGKVGTAKEIPVDNLQSISVKSHKTGKVRDFYRSHMEFNNNLLKIVYCSDDIEAHMIYDVNSSFMKELGQKFLNEFIQELEEVELEENKGKKWWKTSLEVKRYNYQVFKSYIDIVLA